MQVAAVGDGAALDDAALVEEVAEEPFLRHRLALAHDAERARRADHQRGALGGRATGAEVRARAVTERRKRRPGARRPVVERGEEIGVELERRQQLLVPGTYP